jgi:hypothetical protein
VIARLSRPLRQTWTVAAPRASQGALQPAELATAAVMSAVAVAIVVLGAVIRHAGPIQLLAAATGCSAVSSAR